MLHSALRWLSLSLAILFFSVTVSLQAPAAALVLDTSTVASPQLNNTDLLEANRLLIQDLKNKASEFPFSQPIVGLLGEADQFLEAVPTTMCSAYAAHSRDPNAREWLAFVKSGHALVLIVSAIQAASVAGAGSLAGYAGMASAVSHLGLGSATTMIAGLLGSHATGAAATSVVVSFVGGPVVMTAIVVSIPFLLALGEHYLSQLTAQFFGQWAARVCL
ncbi:MAG: hypothetical protein ACO331_07655 [Prochlorothrix sp.]